MWVCLKLGNEQRTRFSCIALVRGGHRAASFPHRQGEYPTLPCPFAETTNCVRSSDGGQSGVFCWLPRTGSSNNIFARGQVFGMARGRVYMIQFCDDVALRVYPFCSSGSGQLAFSMDGSLSLLSPDRLNWKEGRLLSCIVRSVNDQSSSHTCHKPFAVSSGGRQSGLTMQKWRRLGAC